MPERLLELLWQDFALKAVIASEIEFYLHNDGSLVPEAALDAIRDVCARNQISLASAELERGPHQYEVALKPQSNIAQLISDTRAFKILMQQEFARQNVQADFSAKPLPDAPGSGLHIHVHLEDSGKNVFFREQDDFSPLLLHAIGGLLSFMNPCMSFFAPASDSYKRFAKHSNAPTTLSWGTNNRTVAIRLPTKPMDHKHIEHRVSGSDANIGAVISAILAGIHYGLGYKIDPGAPIYGDASLEQYNLTSLVTDFASAQVCTNQCEALAPYLADIQRAT